MKIYRLLPLLTVAMTTTTFAQNDLLPPNAKPGECYARVLVPPTYADAQKQLVKKEGTETIEIIPAVYETVEETIMIKEATEILNVIPATYKTVKETIMVRPASRKLVTVPAKYRTEEEKVQVRAGYTTWKKGRGLIEKLDNGTGEIMCLVEVPPEYKIVRKEVIESPPSTKVVETEAEFKTVTKRVIDEPARVEKKIIPAEFRTMKVQKLVSEAQEKRTKVAPTLIAVSEQAKTKDAYLEWRSVLCETNTNAGVVRKLQQALSSAGHYNGPIDGVIGGATRNGMASYQDSKGLARGELTMETLKSLGVTN